MYLVLTLLIARGITLLTTTSVSSSAIALTSSGMLIRLLRYALEEQTTALSMAPVGVVNEFFFVHQLHGTQTQSVADYLQQVAYSFRGLREQKPPS